MAAKKDTMAKQGGIRLTDEQQKRRRKRSVALALVLGALAVLIYIVSVVDFGAAVLNRPL